MTACTTLAPAAPRGGAAVRLALAAFALFTGMDSCVKLLSPRYPAAQLACLNALVALMPMLAVAALGSGLRRLGPRRRGLQLLRGLCQAAGVPLSFYAYGRMPIAGAYAVLFTMPLLIVALSAPLLGERVGW